MQALTNRNKQVDRKPMNIWERIYLPNIMKGMIITLQHLFKKKATIQYPEQKREFSRIWRGLHVLNRDEEGRERCTACGLCAVAFSAGGKKKESAEREKRGGKFYLGEKKDAKKKIKKFRCKFFGLFEETFSK